MNSAVYGRPRFGQVGYFSFGSAESWIGRAMNGHTICVSMNRFETKGLNGYCCVCVQVENAPTDL